MQVGAAKIGGHVHRLANTYLFMMMMMIDNISKAFATSVSIILSSAISFYFLDFEPSWFFMMGAMMVICATVLYSKAPRRKAT